MSNDNSDLKEEMIREALMILRSVDWAEHQINKKMLDLDRAIANHNYELADRLKAEARQLVSHLNRENKHMDTFMAKYRKLIDHEKKTMLSHSGTKK